MIKSPLRYPGGKSRAVKFLYQFVPAYREFREPFFGGGSMMFYCMQKREHTPARYWANDLNFDLFCFWDVLKNHRQQLVEAIAAVKRNNPDGRSLFYELLEKRKNGMPKFERAVDFFVLNRITFSGVVDSGGYSRQAFKKRFTDSSIERLTRMPPLLEQIKFTTGDYAPLLHEAGEEVFIFLDPPYFSATRSRLYGKRGCLHEEFDHERFAAEMKKCPHRWLITYDSSAYIRALFRDFYQLEWELQYGMNNYKQRTASKGKELLVANFPLKPAR